MNFQNYINESEKNKLSAHDVIALALLKPIKKHIINKFKSEFDEKVKDLFFVELQKIDNNLSVISVATVFTVSHSQYKKDWYFPFCIDVTIDINNWSIQRFVQSDKFFPENTVDDQEYTYIADLVDFMTSKHDLTKF